MLTARTFKFSFNIRIQKMVDILIAKALKRNARFLNLMLLITS